MSVSAPIPVEQFQEAAELRRRLRRFLAHGDATVRRCGLTPQRYLLLLAIKGATDGSESRTVGDLAGDLELAQSSATELVDRAAAAGLVDRGVSPDDGRVVQIRLSEQGGAAAGRGVRRAARGAPAAAGAARPRPPAAGRWCIGSCRLGVEYRQRWLPTG